MRTTMPRRRGEQQHTYSSSTHTAATAHHTPLPSRAHSGDSLVVNPVVAAKMALESAEGRAHGDHKLRPGARGALKKLFGKVRAQTSATQRSQPSLSRTLSDNPDPYPFPLPLQSPDKKDDRTQAQKKLDKIAMLDRALNKEAQALGKTKDRQRAEEEMFKKAEEAARQAGNMQATGMVR